MEHRGWWLNLRVLDVCLGRAQTGFPAFACADPLAWVSLSIFAFQHPAHPSRSNSHINALLILALEIDLYFSLELCYHFICPSWPLSNFRLAQ